MAHGCINAIFWKDGVMMIGNWNQLAEGKLMHNIKLNFLLQTCIVPTPHHENEESQASQELQYSSEKTTVGETIILILFIIWLLAVN